MKTTIKTGKASDKQSKKVQGDSARFAALSDMNMQQAPAIAPRGLGSSYAHAVGNIMHQAKEVKGSKNGFLGQEKKTLDPKEHAHSLLKK